jgi:hypothetical protein
VTVGSTSGTVVSTAVTLDAHEAVNVTVDGPSGTVEHWIRCVPPRFPRITVSGTGDHGDGWYLLANGAEPAVDNYLMILNRDGVPVWYRAGAPGRTPRNLQLLSDGDLAWFESAGFPFGIDPANGYDRRRLDGTLEVTYRVAPPNATNHHDFVELSNGNVLVLSMPISPAPPGTSCWVQGATTDVFVPVDATHVAGARIEELTADGGPTGRVWDADPFGPPGPTRLSYAEENTVPLCFRRQVGATVEYILGAVHPNALAVRGDTVLLSSRHMDAVFAIEWPTGTIRWKLGGRPRPGVSLAVSGDPGAGTKRQHDVQVLPNGDVTVFDNRTSLPFTPTSGAARMVQYRIDDVAGTATFVRELRDPSGRGSGALGSARITDGGSTLLNWGVNASGQVFAEFGPDGTVWFTVSMTGVSSSYRTVWEPATAFDVDVLRQTAGR